MNTKPITKRVSIYDHQSNNQVLMSDRQKKALIELVYQNIFEEDDREMYVAQITEDLMTSEEGSLMALDFQMARWR